MISRKEPRGSLQSQRCAQAGLRERKKMVTSFECQERKIKYCRISKSCSEGFVKIKQTVIIPPKGRIQVRETGQGRCANLLWKTLSLGKGPHIRAGENLHRQERKPKSV